MSDVEQKRCEDQREYVIEDDGGLEPHAVEFLVDFPEKQRKKLFVRIRPVRETEGVWTSTKDEERGFEALKRREFRERGLLRELI